MTLPDSSTAAGKAPQPASRPSRASSHQTGPAGAHRGLSNRFSPPPAAAGQGGTGSQPGDQSTSQPAQGSPIPGRAEPGGCEAASSVDRELLADAAKPGSLCQPKHPLGNRSLVTGWTRSTTSRPRQLEYNKPDHSTAAQRVVSRLRPSEQAWEGASSPAQVSHTPAPLRGTFKRPQGLAQIDQGR